MIGLEEPYKSRHGFSFVTSEYPTLHVKEDGRIYTSPSEIVSSDVFWDHVKDIQKVKLHGHNNSN